MLIYKNYEVFLKLIESYEIGLFNRILYEREYNLRAKKGEDIGIRIKTNRVSDPTARQAIENILIREAIEEANDSGNILKDTDNPQKHKRDILTLQMMRREYEVFDTNLKSLPGNEFRITYRYLHDGCKLMCEYLGCDIGDSIAFGDNYNDVEMLEAAGMGVVMGNAPADIRDRFETVTSDNDDDGIAEILNKI